jgi:hypothetical protein
MRWLHCLHRSERSGHAPEIDMTDNILNAVLTFSLLAGGTAAIGSEMFNTRQGDKAAAAPTVTLPEVSIVAHRATAVVTLPEVTITGRRAAPAAVAVVTLPEVTITGCREAATVVATETNASEPSRVE